MGEIVQTAATKFTNNLPYIGYGALGGYVGAFIIAKYNGVEGMKPLDKYMLESAVAGGVTDYLWLLVGPADMDTTSIIRGMLVGWLGQWVYTKFVKGMLQEMNIV